MTLKEPRNGGRYVWAYVDGHAKTVMYGSYKSPSYPFLIMPKSGKDVERMCYDVNADWNGTTCRSTIDSLLTTRTPF